jgi:hypothetical protein
MSGYSALFHQRFDSGEIVNLQGEEDPSGRFIGLETSVEKHQTGVTEHSSILPRWSTVYQQTVKRLFQLWATKSAYHPNHPNHQIIALLADGRWPIVSGAKAPD